MLYLVYVHGKRKATSRQPIILAKCSQKLRENENNLSPEVGARPWCPLGFTKTIVVIQENMVPSITVTLSLSMVTQDARDQ